MRGWWAAAKTIRAETRTGIAKSTPISPPKASFLFDSDKRDLQTDVPVWGPFGSLRAACTCFGKFFESVAGYFFPVVG